MICKRVGILMRRVLMILLSILLLLSIIFLKISSNNKEVAVYVDNKLSDILPKKGEAVFSKAICDNDVKVLWNNDTWSLRITNLLKKTKCNLHFISYTGDTIYNYDYTGKEAVFTVPVSGTYKLEVWGPKGGDANIYSGGYGAYSVGEISLKKGEVLYLNIGGEGKMGNTGATGGYNGGGNASKNYDQPDKSRQGSGGGATHIALKSGLLSTLENYKSDILIVAGGGGGANYWPGNGNHGLQYGLGGSAGGLIGNSGTGVCQDYDGVCHSPGEGGTQSSPGQSFGTNIAAGFGLGGSGNSTNVGGAGGGAGFYGGGGSLDNAGGGGGSSYIGNFLLTEKVMYCYNCEESDEESTKTISTTCSEETPTENCSKLGNGYARITLISISS